jgi:hypothetical protein
LPTTAGLCGHCRICGSQGTWRQGRRERLNLFSPGQPANLNASVKKMNYE